MHLSKGLTHTSSVAMVWGLHTIARPGSRGKGTEGWIKGSVSLERQALSGICLILSRSAHIPNQHLVGMSLKRDSVNVFLIWTEHVQEWGICFSHLRLPDYCGWLVQFTGCAPNLFFNPFQSKFFFPTNNYSHKCISVFCFWSAELKSYLGT